MREGIWVQVPWDRFTCLSSNVRRLPFIGRDAPGGAIGLQSLFMGFDSPLGLHRSPSSLDLGFQIPEARINTEATCQIDNKPG